jgi:hypothetical protein
VSPAEPAIGRVVDEVAVVVPLDEAVPERGREQRDGDRRDREGSEPSGQRKVCGVDRFTMPRAVPRLIASSVRGALTNRDVLEILTRFFRGREPS